MSGLRRGLSFFLAVVLSLTKLFFSYRLLFFKRLVFLTPSLGRFFDSKALLGSLKLSGFIGRCPGQFLCACLRLCFVNVWLCIALYASVGLCMVMARKGYMGSRDDKVVRPLASHNVSRVRFTDPASYVG